MEIEVELISKDIIKPSSPTPTLLLKHKFSLIDQYQFPIAMPMVFFYGKLDNISSQQRCNLLKHSLSKVLAMYYPIASRIHNYSYAECNDQGALFIEAKANCKLSYILKYPNHFCQNGKKFVASQPFEGVNQYGSLFQFTHFTCGGFAVSFALAHMLGDALSELMFLKDWAAVSRGNTIKSPRILSDSIFPSMNISGFDLTQAVLKRNIVTKLFAFDNSVISALRDSFSPNGEKLSRVQALSAFIVSRMAAATSKLSDDNHNPFIVMHVVNVRPLLDPPVPDWSFGNLIWGAPTMIDDTDPGEMAKRIKDSVASVNAESLRMLRNGELQFDKEAVMESLKGEIQSYLITSVCNFPVHDMDFGWGNPEWVATSLPMENLIVLKDRKDGTGIEAFISMTEEDMAQIEKDRLLLLRSSNQNQDFTSRL